MGTLFRRLRHLLRRSRADAELSEEIETHQALRQSQLERDGMSALEAAHASRRALGNVTLAREESLEIWTWPRLESVAQDARVALRAFRRNPAFTVAAVLTLAVGIGANAAMFSVADATALRPPDIPRPSELVRVFSSSIEVPFGEVSHPDYLDFRSRSTSFAGLAAYEFVDVALSRSATDLTQYLGGWAVSSNFFSVLDVEPRLGRGFRREDERADARVAVISHRLWERVFQQSPAVVGAPVRLSGVEFIIVGVAPESFTGTELFYHPDLFVPLQAISTVRSGTAAGVLTDRSARSLTVIGRLKPPTHAGEANTELSGLARALEQSYPETNHGRGASVLPERTARTKLDSSGVQGALIFMSIVGLVLVLASANVANLMLARSATRTHEMAVRATIGATRARLVRQVLTESLIIALAGAAAGVLIATGTIRYLSTVIVIPSALPLSVDLRVDSRMLSFTGVVSVLAALLLGLVPAVRSTRPRGSSWHARGTSVEAGRPRFTVRAVLVVVQVAISALVLVAAGLMIRAAITAQHIDPGFRIDRVWLVSFNPALVRYDRARGARFYDEVLARIRALPTVEAAGLTRFLPMGVTTGSIALVVDGFQMPRDQERLVVGQTEVDPGYWSVMRTPIVRGRAFDEREVASNARVVIVNETMARRYWPNQDPIGRTIRVPDARGSASEVIGIARDGKYSALADEPRPFVYRLFSRRAVPMTMVVLAKREASLATEIRDAVRAVDPAVPMLDLRTMEDFYRSRPLLPSRVVSRLVTAFGVLGLLVAAIGLYGTLAYLCVQRTREIGIRMALGARSSSVVWMVVRQAAAMLVPGLGFGLGLASLLTPLIGSPAFDFVVPHDPIVFAAAALVIVTAGLIASAFPALRAVRTDATIALRAE